MNTKTRRQVRIQNSIFYILLVIAVILLAKLSIRTNISSDWTANGRHSLSSASIEFLKQLDMPINIQVFANAQYPYQKELRALLHRYQRYSDRLTISYINPDASPDLVRKFNIQQQGEMVVSLNDAMQKHVFDLSEQSLTNALIAVSRRQEKWLIFIEGHGERNPFGQANFDLATWGQQLENQGFKLKRLNLAKHSQIPANATALVIASPELEWLPGEIDIVKSYINDGGHLLWLAEPASNQHLTSLAEALGIEFIAGIVTDPNTQLLGIPDPQFTLITDYSNHAIGIATQGATLFPKAVAIETNAANHHHWHYLPLLITADNAWSETTATDEPASALFDLGEDTKGPLNIGYLLTNENEDGHHQRIAIIGDGDFLSNTYIGNGSNLDLGVSIANWLVNDDDLITIPAKTTIGGQLELNQSQQLLIGLGFLIVLPILLLIAGFIIWWYRRTR